MNIGGIMDGLGVRLATITGLQVYDYPPDNLGAVPAGIVDYPEIDYEYTFRGVQRGIYGVWIIASKVSDRSARDALAEYMKDSGSKSVKAVIEADKTLGGSADSTSVQSVVVEDVRIGSLDYIAARFTIDVIG